MRDVHFQALGSILEFQVESIDMLVCQQCLNIHYLDSPGDIPDVNDPVLALVDPALGLVDPALVEPIVIRRRNKTEILHTIHAEFTIIGFSHKHLLL